MPFCQWFVTTNYRFCHKTDVNPIFSLSTAKKGTGNIENDKIKKPSIGAPLEEQADSGNG
ncbi:MAG: hypothetical protein PHC53_02790 [Patescibacteria group bacterium]|nr:hypothetical protein [Patescibacteria group bacterium]